MELFTKVDGIFTGEWGISFGFVKNNGIRFDQLKIIGFDGLGVLGCLIHITTIVQDIPALARNSVECDRYVKRKKTESKYGGCQYPKGGTV